MHLWTFWPLLVCKHIPDFSCCCCSGLWNEGGKEREDKLLWAAYWVVGMQEMCQSGFLHAFIWCIIRKRAHRREIISPINCSTARKSWEHWEDQLSSRNAQRAEQEQFWDVICNLDLQTFFFFLLSLCLHRRETAYLLFYMKKPPQ